MSEIEQKLLNSIHTKCEIAQQIDSLMRKQEFIPHHVTLFINAHLIDSQQDVNNAWLAIQGKAIRKIGTGNESLMRFREELIAQDNGISIEEINLNGRVLCPGFIDIHTHGGWGYSFDDGPEAISITRAFHLLHGTTRSLLSLVTNPWESMMNNLESASKITNQRIDILGVHLEGPFLSPLHRGAHNSDYLITPNSRHIDEIIERAEGNLRQITLAPELYGGMSAVKRFADAGVVPAVGHSDADYEQTLGAFKCGARILTHMFNGMKGISHRAPGPIVAALGRDDIYLELIADGFHVQDPVLKVVRDIGNPNLVLITDSLAAAGCSNGESTIGTLEVQVLDGKARLKSSGAIAGSTLSLEQAVQHMVLDIGQSLQRTIKAVTYTPAHIFGFDKKNSVTEYPLGQLDAGYSADVLVLNPQTLDVQNVWCNGMRIV